MFCVYKIGLLKKIVICTQNYFKKIPAKDLFWFMCCTQEFLESGQQFLDKELIALKIYQYHNPYHRCPAAVGRWNPQMVSTYINLVVVHLHLPVPWSRYRCQPSNATNGICNCYIHQFRSSIQRHLILLCNLEFLPFSP